jgi:hypothetical protein
MGFKKWEWIITRIIIIKKTIFKGLYINFITRVLKNQANRIFTNNQTCINHI